MSKIVILITSAMVLTGVSAGWSQVQQVTVQKPGATQAQPVPPMMDKADLPTIVLPNDANIATDTAGYGAARDSIQKTLGDLPSLQQICSLSVLALQEVNGYKKEHDIDIYTVRQDTAFGTPRETTVYEMILAYTRLVSFGVPLPGKLPNLIRTRAISDSTSLRVLPVKPGIGALGDGRFFFMGAGPFLVKSEFDEGNKFKDLMGHIEVRYTANVSENIEFIPRIMRRFPHIRMNVVPGPPCGSYDSGPQAVRGIGSLKHVLCDRIPVCFLTKAGVVNAEMVSVTKNLFTEDMGCVTNLPVVEFACPTVSKDEILGIYIPYDSVNTEKCMVKKKGNLWTADINGDGIPDFAGVSHTFSGASSDTMSDIVWYVNVNGKWKVVDAAREPDCT